jgi:AraC family transcriptional activator of tynA and feaB
MQTVWSTSLIPQTQRAEFWRSAVCNAFLSMTPRIAHAADFEARLDHLSLERVALNRVVAPAHGVTRTPSDIRRDEKQVFFINLSPGGRCRVRQFGREHTALAGELILIDSNSPYSIDLPDDGELLSLAVPHDWLCKLAPSAHESAARKLPESTASHLLRRQMLELTRLPQIDTAQTGLISQVMVSLLAGCLSSQSAPNTSTPARLHKLQQLIAHHHPDPSFGPPVAAQLAGLSLRSLHLAFAQAGATFGAELMNYRLARARQILLHSEQSLSVSGLALDCGFKSAEHFSRRFRERYGVAPSRLAS